MISIICHANPRSSINALRLYGIILVIVLLANPVAAFSWPNWHVAPTIALALANDDYSPASPDATAITHIERGSKIFLDNCASCHAGGMNYVKEQKTLKKDALAKFITQEFNQPIVQKWVTNSGQHQRIVFFKAPNGKLTESDWADVTTYVVDQALNDKW